MRHVQKFAVLAVLGFGITAAWSQTPGQTQEPMSEMDSMHHGTKPMGPASPLRISFGAQSAEWTPEKLATLPHTTITVFNGHVKANQTYSGVPLIDLLKPLGVPDAPKGKDFRIYLEAEGADGYVVVYSVAEVTPYIHDGMVIVADTVDGKPLTETGPFQLVATGEKHPARWVRNLVAVRVQHAE